MLAVTPATSPSLKAPRGGPQLRFWVSSGLEVGKRLPKTLLVRSQSAKRCRAAELCLLGSSGPAVPAGRPHPRAWGGSGMGALPHGQPLLEPHRGFHQSPGHGGAGWRWVWCPGVRFGLVWVQAVLVEGAVAKGDGAQSPPEDPRSPWAHQTLRQGQAGSKPSRTPGEEEAEAEEREAEGQEEKLRRASASRRGSGTAGRGRGSRNLPGRLRLAVSRL